MYFLEMIEELKNSHELKIQLQGNKIEIIGGH